MGYQFSLPMVLRWHASRAKAAPLETITEGRLDMNQDEDFVSFLVASSFVLRSIFPSGLPISCVFKNNEQCLKNEKIVNFSCLCIDACLPRLFGI